MSLLNAYLCVHADAVPTSLSTGATLSTGVAAGISVITGTIALVFGVLAGVLVHHCRQQQAQVQSMRRCLLTRRLN